MQVSPKIKAFFEKASVAAAFWCLLGILGGAVTSGYISEVYFEKSNSKAIAEAIEKARSEGHIAGLAEGVQQGLAAAKANEPKMIEERYPGATKQAHDLGFAEGHKAGLDQGQKVGFESGQKAGHDAAVKELSLQSYAAKNWKAYARKVLLVAESADRLDGQPGNDRLQRQLLADAGSLVAAADALREAYQNQGKAFNGTMDSLKEAVAARDFQAMRIYARSLRGALDTKGALFLEANESVVKVFDDLSRPPKAQ